MPARSFGALFFLSGCTSLVYEIVFHKLLGYVFGSSALATTTVLVTFMGGLALGGRLIGERADRVQNPAALYGWFELAIGVYVLLVPALLRACMQAYARWGVSSDVHAWPHVLLRFVLSACVLLLPTLLMGGTLPLLSRAVARTPQSISRLYAINTLGAAAGTLFANYVLLPYLGIYGALGLGAAVNLFIWQRALRLARPLESANATLAADLLQPSAADGTDPRRLFALAVPATFAVGLVSFCYEIVWTHLLATIVGMSVYAFGLMLATFLAGLALGGLAVARGLGSRGDRFQVIACLQLALGFVVLASLPLWDRLPLVFARVGEHRPSFLAMELTRAAVCAAMLLPPCTLIGATFPILLGSAAFEPEHVGARVGRLYAWNTLGCILGAVLTGFLLLEQLGSRTLLIACAYVSLGLGAAHALPSAGRKARAIALLLTAAGVGLGLALPQWDWKNLAAGMNVSFNRGALIYEVLWAREDAHSGITTVTRERRGLTLRTNGKFQADDHTELLAQQGFALLPLLFVADYGRVLNIGYGSGMTAGVLSRFPFRHIEIAELSPAMVEAADAYFSQVNLRARGDPRTRLVYDDGRNHLLVSHERYDLITVEITSIWFAGAASLYSQEFYELCKRRLTDTGVLQQWVQLHHISRRDLLVLWNTLRAVFPYVSLWRQGTQGALIASTRPQAIDYAHVVSMNQRSEAAVVRQRLPTPDFFALLGAQQLDPPAMDAMLRELPEYVPAFLIPYARSRDYFPYLEYSTPRGYALPDSAEGENIAWIKGHDRGLLPALKNVPDAATQHRIELLAAAGSGDCARFASSLHGAALPADLERTLREVRRRCARGGL